MKLLDLLQKDVTGRIKARDLIIISRQMATMIKAGVPVVQSLRMILRQMPKESVRRTMNAIINEVEGGSSLSRALIQFPKVFSPFYISVIQAGEASGRLTHAFNVMADHLEQNYLFMRKLQSALAYPVLILIAVAVVMSIIFSVIIPQLVQIFAEANIELPLTTRIVVWVAVFFQNYWLILIVLLGLLGLVARSYFKTPEGRYTLSSFALHVPVLQTLLSKIYLTRLTSILHTLFDSDVPILDSLELARHSIGNRVYQRILSDTIKGVKDGMSMSSVWEKEPFIPPLLTSIVSVGEKNGEVGQAFNEAHKFFQRDVEDALNNITVMLEPLMVIFLGIVVGVIVAAVLMPIYNLVLVL